MSEPKLVQKVRQSGTGRDVSIFHATHKGREEIVLSQPTPDGRQLVEVAVDPDRLGELIEALQSLYDYLRPRTHQVGSPPRGAAGSLKIGE